jgi:hypothetical protein
VALADNTREMQLDALVLNDVSPELFSDVRAASGFYPSALRMHKRLLVSEGDLGAGALGLLLYHLQVSTSIYRTFLY